MACSFLSVEVPESKDTPSTDGVDGEKMKFAPLSTQQRQVD